MLSRCFRPLALLAVLSAPAWVGAAPVPRATGPKTPTPEEFVRLFGEAFQAAENDDRESRTTERLGPFLAERYQPLIRSTHDASVAADELGDALDKRFGKAAPEEFGPGRRGRALRSRTVRMELVEKKELAPDRIVVRLLLVETIPNFDPAAPGAAREREVYFEVPFLLVKDEGNWRLCPPSSSWQPDFRDEKRKTGEGKEVSVTVLGGEPVEMTDVERATLNDGYDWAAHRLRRLTRDVEGGRIERRDEATEIYLRVLETRDRPLARLMSSPAEWPGAALKALRGGRTTDSKPE